MQHMHFQILQQVSCISSRIPCHRNASGQEGILAKTCMLACNTRRAGGFCNRKSAGPQLLRFTSCHNVAVSTIQLSVVLSASACSASVSSCFIRVCVYHLLHGVLPLFAPTPASFVALSSTWEKTSKLHLIRLHDSSTEPHKQRSVLQFLRICGSTCRCHFLHLCTIVTPQCSASTVDRQAATGLILQGYSRRLLPVF